MQRIRTEILPGVWLTALRTEKFKTAWLSVNLLTQLRRETAACTAVLPYVLRCGCTRLPDLEAIAAELERGAHVAETPLADVERGAPVVVEARVAVWHDHLRERQPVGDLAPGARIVEAEAQADKGVFRRGRLFGRRFGFPRQGVKRVSRNPEGVAHNAVKILYGRQL